MDTNNGENFTRQPSQFGSLPSPAKYDLNIAQKRLIISGILSQNKDKIETMLNILDIKDYKYLNLNENILITFPTILLAKEHLKTISDYLKNNNLDSIKVKFYEPKDERNVYVKNLPLHFTETALSELFQPYGCIISKKIIQKPNNNNSIGFVRYTSKEEAEKAINDINNKNLCLLNSERTVRCEFSKSSNPTSNSEAHRTNNNYFSNQVPRFQNNRYQEIQYHIPNYSSVHFQYPPMNDNSQFINQFSNMYVSANNQYGPSYGAPNFPIYFSFPGTYQGYPYVFYSSNNQNYNYPS